MRVNGKQYRTVWMDGSTVRMIDQNRLPFELAVVECRTHRDTADAIRDMTVRGAPAIGAAAAFAIAQSFLEVGAGDPWPCAIEARALIEATRPTARDLFAGVEHVWKAVCGAPGSGEAIAALAGAHAYAEANVQSCQRLGDHGAALIRDGARVLTHCNAGWLCTVDHGTALAPIYAAASAGRKPFVWVGETRPRAQGGRLTAWELAAAGIDHAVLADTAAAHLMSRGEVDLVIVGADRVAANGDVVNKIGTLERAICAKEFGIPFYVSAPPSTFDSSIPTGADVVIEERSADELHYQTGPDDGGVMRRIRVTAPGARGVNPAFDVTPARLVTAFITDAGVFAPGERPAPAPATPVAR